MLSNKTVMILNINKTNNNVTDKIDYDEYIEKRNDVIYLSRIVIKNEKPLKIKIKNHKKNRVYDKDKKLKPKVYTDNKIKSQNRDNR